MTLLYMSAYQAGRQGNQDIGAVISDERDPTGSGLEKKVQSELGQHHGSKARRGAYSIKRLNDLIENYIKRGEKALLDAYISSLQRKGYRIPHIPQKKAASDHNPDAVAFTDGETLLGVHIDFEGQIQKMAHYGISKETAEYLAITEELIHIAQPWYIRSNNITAEIDAKERMTEILKLKVEQSNSASEIREYQRAASFMQAQKRAYEAQQGYRRTA